MTFEIWEVTRDGGAALMSDIQEDDRQQFRQQGWRFLNNIEADNIQEAQDRFTAWCRTVCPGAREHGVDLNAVRDELVRMQLDQH